MASPELEEFARLLVQNVRDAAIQSCDGSLHPDADHSIARRWRKAASSGTPEEFAKVLIPDIVDDTLFQFLLAIDNGLLKISFTASNGKTVDLATEGYGEMPGSYMGMGWRDVYSKERFIDFSSDPT